MKHIIELYQTRHLQRGETKKKHTLPHKITIKYSDRHIFLQMHINLLLYVKQHSFLCLPRVHLMCPWLKVICIVDLLDILLTPVDCHAEAGLECIPVVIIWCPVRYVADTLGMSRGQWIYMILYNALILASVSIKFYNRF